MKVKGALTITIVLLVSGLLFGCARQAEPYAVSGQAVTSPATAGENSLSIEMKLALGTLGLAGTDYPLNAEQKPSLLLLWKAMRSLADSSTTADQEIEALLNQIQDTFTAEQLQAIEDMDISNQDLVAIEQDLGLEIGGNMDPQTQATLQFAQGGGQVPPDGFGAGEIGGMGEPPSGDISVSLERPAELDAQSASAGANLRLPSTLLDALIEYLQSS